MIFVAEATKYQVRALVLISTTCLFGDHVGQLLALRNDRFGHLDAVHVVFRRNAVNFWNDDPSAVIHGSDHKVRCMIFACLLQDEPKGLCVRIPGVDRMLEVPPNEYLATHLQLTLGRSGLLEAGRVLGLGHVGEVNSRGLSSRM